MARIGATARTEPRTTTVMPAAVPGPGSRSVWRRGWPAAAGVPVRPPRPGEPSPRDRWPPDRARRRLVALSGRRFLADETPAALPAAVDGRGPDHRGQQQERLPEGVEASRPVHDLVDRVADEHRPVRSDGDLPQRHLHEVGLRFGRLDV